MKAQTAMDYLLTYSWAILIVIIVGVALFVLSVSFFNQPLSITTVKNGVNITSEREVTHLKSELSSNKMVVNSPQFSICVEEGVKIFNLKSSFRCTDEGGGSAFDTFGENYNGWVTQNWDSLHLGSLIYEEHLLGGCWYYFPVSFVSEWGYEHFLSTAPVDWSSGNVPLTIKCTGITEYDTLEDVHEIVEHEFSVHFI